MTHLVVQEADDAGVDVVWGSRSPTRNTTADAALPGARSHARVTWRV